MKDATVTRRTDKKNHKGRRCLACGVSLTTGRRRYCTIDCRQRLRRKLDLRTGLLKALNTRYATFYITDQVIVLDVLPFDSADIFSFIFTRSQGRKPADDFSRMADVLGNAWWSERRRTHKKYLASRHVLGQAERNHRPAGSVKPRVVKNPSVNGASLIQLKLNRSALSAPELEKIIKRAYRRQAKLHHPDLGGDTAQFRKIQRAYEDLIRWAENPSFSNRRGFPDKWFYDGYRNKWVQPTPEIR